MVRKLAAALLGVGVMVPGLVQALGLGGIKLNSALSEPLDAEIELVQVRELTEEEILPSLASNADFSAAGVEKYHFLTEMKFDVVVNPNGRSYIKVTSRKPMKEPFVNFLVEVHWPEGRLLREYTMLLDPPVYRAQAAPVIQRSTVAVPKTAPRVSPQPVSRAAPSAASTSAPSASVSAPAPVGSGQTYGPTGPSDSLWGIASQLRPSSSVNVQQTMLAIQRLNPQAFVNGNINLLKRGQVLRAPSEQDALSISSQDAIRMVAEQNRAWREKVPTPSTAQAAPVDTTGNSAGAVPTRVEEEEGKLSLVSPAKTEAVVGETAQGGEASGTGGVLRDKLAMAEETTDKFKLENEDLKLKLNDLQQQADTSNQVLKLKDDQIAALQAKMAELQAQLEQVKAGSATATTPSAPATETVAPVSEATSAAPEASAPVASADADTIPAPEAEAASTQAEVDYNYVEPAEDTAPAEEAPTSTGQVEVVDGGGVVSEITKPSLVESETPKPTQPVVSEKSLLDELRDNWYYLLGIAGLGVAGVFGAALSRRKKAESSELDEALVKDFALPAQTNEPVEEFQQAAPVADAKPESTKEEVVPQTGDVVGEADIYIAYGRFTQAAEMLEKAAAKEPGRDDIRVKLLEVAVESKNPDLFERHAAAVSKSGNPASISRVEALRAKLAGTAAAVAAVSVAQQLTPEKDEDLDSLEELEFDAGSIDFSKPAETKPSTDSVGGLDFSLDFRLTDTPVETKPQAPKVEVADDNSLDFDLEMDLEKEFSPAAETKAAPVDSAADLDMEALEFEGDFSFSPSQETAPVTTTLEEDQGIELELELADEAPLAELVDNEAVDFELVDDIQSASASPALAEEDDIRHAMDFENEDTIDSSSAALLADELDFPEPSAEQTVAGESFELDQVALETTAAPMVAPVAFNRAEPAQGEEDLDFITDGDEASTKLDLARAYIDMGDREGARDILDEVLAEGNAEQQSEARELLARLE